jgi:hypothetical protein
MRIGLLVSASELAFRNRKPCNTPTPHKGEGVLNPNANAQYPPVCFPASRARSACCPDRSNQWVNSSPPFVNRFLPSYRSSRPAASRSARRSVPALQCSAAWLGDGSRHDDSGGADDIDDYWWHELQASSETESHSQHHPPAVPAPSNSSELSPDRDNVLPFGTTYKVGARLR